MRGSRHLPMLACTLTLAAGLAMSSWSLHRPAGQDTLYQVDQPTVDGARSNTESAVADEERVLAARPATTATPTMTAAPTTTATPTMTAAPTTTATPTMTATPAPTVMPTVSAPAATPTATPMGQSAPASPPWPFSVLLLALVGAVVLALFLATSRSRR